MAEIKKYLDLQTGLPQLVTEIKAADEAVLAAAKKYTDEAPFDAAGSSVTAEKNAKDYADAEIAKVNENLAKKADQTALEAEAKARGDKDAELQGLIEATDAKAVKNAEDIAAINNAETGILKQAKDFATSEDAKLQTNIDTLNQKIGNLPEGTSAKDVVDYVNIKTAGIATDAALGELQGQLSGVQQAVEELTQTHADDKAELAEDIATAQGAADGAQAYAEGVAANLVKEQERAEEVESGLRADIDEVMGDYLKKADKEELAADIKENTDAIAVLNGDEDGSVNKKITDAINTFATQITEDGTINTFKEVLNYIGTHGGEASEMMAAIDALEALVGDKAVATQIAEAIAAENLAQYATDEELAAVIARIVVLEGAKHTHTNATVLDGITAEKVAAWDAAETNAKAHADAEVAKDRTRLDNLEAKFVEGDGSVSDMIDDAVAAGVADAVAQAESKDAALKTEVNGYTDAEVAKDRARLDALEAIDHEHANKTELDKFADGDKAKLDEAYAKAHEHANATELAKIADGDVAKWNAAEQNAKDFATGLNTTMQGTVDGVTARVKTLEDTIVDKAETSVVTALAERVTTNEELSASNKARLDSFVAISAEEVTALFA